MPSRRPVPDVRGVLVVARRRRREGHTQGEAWQPQPQARAYWPSPLDWEDTPLVRPYVVALDTLPRNARTGAQACPWEVAR